ncbi:hypothetical protein COY06_05715, partial [Candidatus Peregrinibacteria bacterium CG_4_10_14_0_2_um_filter_41_8]
MASKLLNLFGKEVNQIVVDLFKLHKNITLSGTSNISAKAFIASDLLKRENIGTVLWVVNDEQEKLLVQKNLKLWTSRPVLNFTIKQNMGNDRHITRQNNLALTHVTSQILEQEKQIILMTYPEFLIATPSPQELIAEKTTLTLKEDKSLVKLFEQLITIGYQTSPDAHINPGQYFCQGNLVKIFPVNQNIVYRIEIDFDQIVAIQQLTPDQKSVDKQNIETVTIYPVAEPKANYHFYDILEGNQLLIEDELGIIDDFFDEWEAVVNRINSPHLEFKTFAEDTENHKHLHYTSVVRYNSPIDFINDIKIKKDQNWRFIVATKHSDELIPLFNE